MIVFIAMLIPIFQERRDTKAQACRLNLCEDRCSGRLLTREIAFDFGYFS
jgi:hypothetical protein